MVTNPTNYNFSIIYRPGPKNEKADALTRRSRDLPEGKEDEHSGVIASVLQPRNFAALAYPAPRRPPKELEDRIRKALETDEFG